MARTKRCPQCAEDVKAEAKVCRFCGHEFPPAPSRASKVPGRRWWLWALGIFVGLAFLSGFNARRGQPTNEPTSTEPKSAEESASSKLQAGTALAAGRAIKAAARNPDSVVIEWAGASPDGHILCVRYRAQNGFGGMNREHISFDNGKPRESALYWNKHCRSDDMSDLTQQVQLGTRLS